MKDDPAQAVPKSISSVAGDTSYLTRSACEGRVGPGNCTLSPSQIPYVNLSIHTARVTA